MGNRSIWMNLNIDDSMNNMSFVFLFWWRIPSLTIVKFGLYIDWYGSMIWTNQNEKTSSFFRNIVSINQSSLFCSDMNRMGICSYIFTTNNNFLYSIYGICTKKQRLIYKIIWL